MPKIFHGAAIVILLSAFCASAQTPQTACGPELQTTTDLASDEYAIQAHALGTKLDFEGIKTYIRRFTGEEPLSSGISLVGRDNKETRQAARDEIIHIARSLGYTEITQEDVEDGANIIIESPGTLRDDEVFELNAHYDTRRTGADDNTSGIAVLLTLLKTFKENPHERHVRFVFADLEEVGFVGSGIHSQKVAADEDAKKKLFGTLIVDMIGWAHAKTKTFLGVFEVGKEKHQLQRSDYERQLEFAKELYFVLARIGKRDQLIMSPETDRAKPFTTDLGRYWQRGLPAVLVAAPYESGFVNPNNHMSTDTIETMNLNYYEHMARAIVEMAAYAAKTQVADLSLLNESEWSELAALENRQVARAEFQLPEATDRAVSLDQEYRYDEYANEYAARYKQLMGWLQRTPVDQWSKQVSFVICPDQRPRGLGRKQSRGYIRAENGIVDLWGRLDRPHMRKLKAELARHGAQFYDLKPTKRSQRHFPHRFDVLEALEAGREGAIDFRDVGIFNLVKKVAAVPSKAAQ